MKRMLGITGLLGALTVVLGAFGAHYLKDTLDAEALKSFETGVRYQMYHVLLLLFVLTNQKLNLKQKRTIGMLTVMGIVLFSGSIYAITWGVKTTYIWFITPLGGLCFILGWVFLARSFFQLKA